MRFLVRVGSVVSLAAFVVGGAAVSTAGAAAYVPTKIQGNGQFQIVGTRFYDPQGNEFIAKGVNVQGQNYWWPREVTQDADKIVDSWKFNMVRVGNIILQNGGFPDNNDLDKIVQEFTSRGVVVMLEAHDKTGYAYEGDDLTKLKDFYAGLATKYKNNPYVWYNVMNEPSDGMSDKDANGNFNPARANAWITEHQEVIKTIRDGAGANNIIIADAMNYAQDVGELWTSDPVKPENSSILTYGDQLLNFNGKHYDNVGFGWHPYGWWYLKVTQGTGLKPFVDQVYAKNYALFIDEWTQGTPDEATPLLPINDQMRALADEYGMGKVVWSWYGGDVGRLVTDVDLTMPYAPSGGWMINDDTNPTNLSRLGQWVWDDNHGIGTVPEPGVAMGALVVGAFGVLRRGRRAERERAAD